MLTELSRQDRLEEIVDVDNHHIRRVIHKPSNQLMEPANPHHPLSQTLTRQPPPRSILDEHVMMASAQS